MILLLPGQRSSVAADGHNSLHVILVKRDELTAVLVGGPIAKHGSPVAAELGDMGRWETCHQPHMSVAVIGPGS
jgi:hypothetical protein